MTLSSVTVKKVVAFYVLIGSVICIFLFLSYLGFLGFLSYLFPALFTLILYLFLITGGFLYLQKPYSKGREVLLNITLAIQTIQLSILGIHFENYFGPYAGIGVDFTSTLNFFFEFHSLSFQNRNGYSKGSNEMSLAVNLVPVAILLFISYLEKKEKEKRPD